MKADNQYLAQTLWRINKANSLLIRWQKYFDINNQIGKSLINNHPPPEQKLKYKLTKI